jgi:hypothetical protein
VADWVTISALATAGGTLVLAAATFASVRSANRAARVAERSLLLGLRPVLLPTRPEDPDEHVKYLDHALVVRGGMSAVEVVEGRLYFAFALRNVGAGLAVLQGWQIRVGRPSASDDHSDPDEFRMLQRDLYVAPGDKSYWQGAVRNAEDPLYPDLRSAIDSRQPMAVEVLYGDHEGGQRTISRYGLVPSREGPEWSCTVLTHWQLEGLDPRHSDG